METENGFITQPGGGGGGIVFGRPINGATANARPVAGDPGSEG